MDKQKSKDMLAAGKKKLQEFRQKKQTKGSHGKASDKSKSASEQASFVQSVPDLDQKPDFELEAGVPSRLAASDENSNAHEVDSGKVDQTRGEERMGLATGNVSSTGEQVDLVSPIDGFHRHNSDDNEEQGNFCSEKVGHLHDLPDSTEDADSPLQSFEGDPAVIVESVSVGSGELEEYPENFVAVQSNDDVQLESNCRSSGQGAFGEGQEVNAIKEEYFSVDESGRLVNQVGPVQDINSSVEYRQRHTDQVLQPLSQLDSGRDMVVSTPADQEPFEVNLGHHSEHDEGPVDVASSGQTLTEEEKNVNIECSRQEIERSFHENEGLLSEVATYKESLMQAQEENIQLTAKNELLEQQFLLENMCLEKNLQETTNENITLKIGLDETVQKLHLVQQSSNEDLVEENTKLLKDVEHLKQIVCDMEAEKLDITSTLEEMRTQLQSEAEGKKSLSHQLDISEQKLREVIGEGDARCGHIEASDTEIENVKKESSLEVDDLMMSKSSLMECRNQFELEFMNLQQKLQALESEKVIALSKLKDAYQMVTKSEPGSLKEIEQVENSNYNELSLDHEIEIFCKEAKLREEDCLTKLEIMRRQLQLVVDEKDALLLKLDEQANTRMDIENNFKQVFHSIVEMRAMVDIEHKNNDCLTSNNKQYELDASTLLLEDEILKDGVLSTREHTEQLSVQICQLKDQLQQILDHKFKLMADLDGYDASVKKLSSEKEELMHDLQLSKCELEQNRYKYDLQENLEIEKHNLLEEKNKLSLELHECKKQIQELMQERSQFTSKMELKEQNFFYLFKVLTQAQQDLTSLVQPKGEDNLGEVKQVPINLQTSNASPRDEELDDLDGIHPPEIKFEMDDGSLLQEVKRLQECIREVESDFLRIKEDYGSAQKQLLELENIRLQYDVLSKTEKTTLDTKVRGLQQVVKQDSHDDDKIFVLKAHLYEAEAALEKIQKVVQEMFRDPSNLSKGSRKVPARISKLIHAFEAKAQLDDKTLEADYMTGTEDSSQQSSETAEQVDNSNSKHDANFVLQPFREVEDGIGHLRTILSQLENDIDCIQQHVMEEEKQKGYLADGFRQLEVDAHALRQQSHEKDKVLATLTEKNAQLMAQALEDNSQMEKLIAQIHDLQKHINEESEAMHTELQRFHNEFSEKTSLLEEEKKSYVLTMLNAAQSLEEFIQIASSNPACESGPVNVDSRLATCVKGTIEKIRELRNLETKLEFTHQENLQIERSFDDLTQNFETMQKERDQLGLLLYKIHKCLGNLSESQETMSVHKEMVGHLEYNETKEAEEELQNVPSVLPFDVMSSDLDKFVGQLQEKLGDRLYHETKANEHIQDLEAKCMELSTKCGEFEERCADLEAQSSNLSAEKNALSSELVTVRRAFAELEEAIEVNSKVHSQLNGRLDLISEKLVAVVDDEVVVTDSNEQRLSRVEAYMLQLIEKYKASLIQINLFQECIAELVLQSDGDPRMDRMEMPLDVALREAFSCKEMELIQLREKLSEINSARVKQEEEMKKQEQFVRNLEEELKSASMDRDKALFDFEQSEQKLSSVREKLSKAVSRGKGLVQQRDALKQSLASKSDELERCRQELQIKTTALHEAETKIKSFGEAGERVEALESELAYIRNSATALRESFLHKDSILQKIEEILDELSLPDEFHAKETIEKIEWLARSCAVENVPLFRSLAKEMSERDEKDVMKFQLPNSQMDAFKLSQNEVIEDLRRKHEELQRKYLSLAEQSDMLEQCLLERNQLIQRWEEVLDNVQIPLSVSSMEPEDRIEWLGRAFNQALQDVAYAQKQIESVRVAADSLATELEESQRNVSRLEADLSTINHEKEFLLKNFEELTAKHKSLMEQSDLDASEKEALSNNIIDLKNTVTEQESDLKAVKNDTQVTMNRLLVMIREALQVEEFNDIPSGISNEYLEGCLRNLVDKIKFLSGEVQMCKESNEKETSHVVVQPSNAAELSNLQVALDAKEQELFEAARNLEASTSTVILYESEREALIKNCRAFSQEVQAAKNERDALKIQLDESEQKLLSAKEKLSRAVKKGKGLVQQRDNLKQIVDEKVTEIERLKKELQMRESAISEFEAKITYLSSALDNFGTLESEVIRLRSHGEQLEQSLHEGKIVLQQIMTALDAIDFTHEAQIRDPVKEIELIIKSFRELEGKLVLSEQEVKKSKKAAELLAAELDEVHERMESLEDELAGAQCEVLALREEKTSLVALAEDLNEVSGRFSNQNYALLKVHADLEHLREEHDCLLPLLANDFFKKLELLGNVESTLQGILNQLATLNDLEVASRSSNWPEERGHSSEFGAASYHEDAVPHLREHSVTNERQMTDQLLSSLLHELETCNGCVEILKSRLGKQSATFNQKSTCLLQLLQIADAEVATVAKSFRAMKLNVESLQDFTREKDTEIFTMQRKIAFLQETEAREAEKSRACEELDIQLKHAETVADNLKHEKDMDKARICELEKCMKTLENDYHLLELRLEDFQARENIIREMQDEMRSLNDAVSAKNQEIEVLMQALDVADMQMENLSSKGQELENKIQQKQSALENLESSHDKAVAKLSSTVNRLEDLRKLSEGLLAEVESLQLQLESRDAEVSRLRQEVTRCTNDVLYSQENMKTKAVQLQEIETWLERMVSKCAVNGGLLEDRESSRIHALEKWIAATISEIESFHMDSKNKGDLLLDAQNRIHELSSKVDLLEANLHDKQTEVERLQKERVSGHGAISGVEVSEIEAIAQISKRSVPLAHITPHVRSTRKSSNDHLALNLDVESGPSTLDLEDDDKGHVFKSLTASRLVPKVTRPIADRIDGIWVSGGRVLMRQPSARLGLIFYWIMLHLWIISAVL